MPFSSQGPPNNGYRRMPFLSQGPPNKWYGRTPGKMLFSYQGSSSNFYSALAFCFVSQVVMLILHPFLVDIMHAAFLVKSSTSTSNFCTNVEICNRLRNLSGITMTLVWVLHHYCCLITQGSPSSQKAYVTSLRLDNIGAQLMLFYTGLRHFFGWLLK